MKISHIILMIIGALVFLMLGCFLFFGVCIGLSSIQDVYKDVERLYAHRFLAGLVGLFFLSIGYIAVKILLKRSGKDELFVVDNEYGRTSIALAAVDDLIRKKIKRFENIKRYRIKLTITNRLLEVAIRLVIDSTRPASEFSSFVHEEIQKIILNSIGIPTDNLKITVTVTKVIESSSKVQPLKENNG
jgi:hypothetical protein